MALPSNGVSDYATLSFISTLFFETTFRLLARLLHGRKNFHSYLSNIQQSYQVDLHESFLNAVPFSVVDT